MLKGKKGIGVAEALKKRIEDRKRGSEGSEISHM